MSKLLTVLAFASLAGCATCRDHPVACAVVGAVIIGGAVAALDTRHSDRDRQFQPRQSPCQPEGITPCAK